MLSKFSVKKPYTIIVAVVLILILGGISFVNLQTDLLPNLDLPFLVINTQYQGASPEEVEMVVTKPIEQIVARTSNIKDVNSISDENMSTVIIEFDQDVNMDSTIIELNSNLDLVKGVWDESVGSPMIIRLNPDMLPIMISSVDVKDMDVKEISELVKDDIIPELESVAGMASVDGMGIIEEKIDVVLSKDKIDKINNKILNKVDSELLDVENELNSAKEEIESGQTELDSEESAQLAQLNEAEEKIKEGKSGLNEGKDALKQGLNELKNKREELLTAKKELEGKEKELVNLIKQFEGMEEGLLQPEQIVMLENTLKGLAQLESGKEEIENGLVLVDTNIDELESQALELSDQLVDLNFKEQDIKTGKLTLSNEIDKVRGELKSGEKELSKNIKEFEDKKDDAFKSASLEGVIDNETISGILMAQNFSMPAGYLGETDKLVKVGDKLESIEEMEDLLLFDTGEEGIGKIYLKDVSDISNIDNSKEIYAKVNGNNAIVLNFQKQSNYSTSEVSKNVKEKMDDLRGRNDELAFTNLMDQGIYIDIVVESVLKNIIFGGILAILILMFFLRDIKPTFIIAVSIPISVIFAIAMMYFTGVTINIISLSGLALGVGMLVDNSIVVIENIYRLRNEGVSRVEASIRGAKEVAGAITASTITTACVFLPIVFTKGVSKELFSDMGLTIAYSLFASLLVALTLVPTMSSIMLTKTKVEGRNIFDKVRSGYENILEIALDHRALVMTVVVLLLVFSAYLTYNMGTSFLPDMESPQMNASLEMPKDSSIEETIDMSNKFIEKINVIEGIETIGALKSETMGGLGGGQSGIQSVDYYILLDEDKKTDNAKISKEIEENTNDLEAEISVDSSSMDMTAIGGSGVEVVIKGMELDELQAISNDVEKMLKETNAIEDIESGSGDGTEEIKIIVNKEKAMENGLTTAEVFSEINDILKEDTEATELTLKNKEFPVVVMEEQNLLLDKDSLLELEIENNNDEKISLKDIVEVKEQLGVSSISRQLQQRNIAVNGDLKEGYNIGIVSRDLEKVLNDYDVPEGYSIEITGENETINESLKDLALMLLLSIVFIYLIMVAGFQSLLSPFIIMFTIPLAFTGGLLALWITGNNLSLIAMLGFLVLSGVVVNNGIVFVDYTNQVRQTGISKKEALILTGRTRLRPIIMTASTTILGLSTLAFGIGTGSEMIQPLAIVAIGGLFYATILTLFVVPIMYDLLNKEEVIIRGEFDEE